MPKNNQKELLRQIEKLHRYCTQYASREANIRQALGVTGSNLLVSVFELSNQLNGDNDTSLRE